MTKEQEDKLKKLLNDNLKHCQVSIYPACFFPPTPKDKKDSYLLFISYAYIHKTKKSLYFNNLCCPIDLGGKTFEEEAQNVIQFVSESIRKDQPLNPDLLECPNSEYRFPYPDDFKTCTKPESEV